MYISSYPVKIDEKGRAIVPKELRELFHAEGVTELVLAMDRGSSKHEQVKTYSYLDLVPWPEWVKRMDKLFSKYPADPVLEEYIKYYVMPAKKVSFDSAGRILIPQLHREWAGLDRQVIIVGAIKTLQIWDAESWSKSLTETAEHIPEIKAALSGLFD